jgi:mono/diheme cytochrome c family protein
MPDQKKYIIWAFMILVGLLACLYFVGKLFNNGSQGNKVVSEIKITDTNGKMGKEFADGKILFRNNCAACHNLSGDIDGPRLDNIELRWPDKKLLYEFIRNSEEVIKKNQYARELWLSSGKRYCMKFPDIKDEELDAIFMYIRKWELPTE